MNFQKKYRQNRDLIQRYAEFLPFCTTLEQRIKLSCEIGKLQEHNDQISQMTLLQLLQPIELVELRISSEL